MLPVPSLVCTYLSIALSSKSTFISQQTVLLEIISNWPFPSMSPPNQLLNIRSVLLSTALRVVSEDATGGNLLTRWCPTGKSERPPLLLISEVLMKLLTRIVGGLV